MFSNQLGVGYNFTQFFTKTRIELVLSAITFTLRKKYPQQISLRFNPKTEIQYPRADAWHAFVARGLREQNMAYSLDNECGVHYFVDEEFETNRGSTLKSLEAPRYSGVRTAFEAAHRYLDTQPPDTKASVRSTFESIEILARLMNPERKNLNKWQVTNKLKPLAQAATTDATETDTIGKLFDGFAQWVDGLQNYRHGQGVEQAIAPSLTLAVYVISTGAAILRWLVEIDSRQSRA